MKHFVFTIFSLLLGLTLCAQQPEKSDLEKENIRGKVKKLTYESISYFTSDGEHEYLYEDEDMAGDDGCEVTEILVFDIEEEAAEYLSERENLYADDTYDSTDDTYDTTEVRSYTETFNKDGYMLEGNYDMSSTYKRTKTYDKKNNLIKDEFQDYDYGSYYYYDYEYEKGLLVRELCYSEGELYYDSRYEYENGDLVRETVIDGEDNAPYIIYKYVWSEDRRTKETYRLAFENDTLLAYKIERFDNDGRVTEMCEFSSDDHTTVGFYKYDRNGNAVESFDVQSYYYSSSKLHKKEYDQWNNVIFEKGYLDSEKDVTYYEYEYDDHGNWISRKCYDGEERRLYNEATRTFEYYR